MFEKIAGFYRGNQVLKKILQVRRYCDGDKDINIKMFKSKTL